LSEYSQQIIVAFLVRGVVHTRSQAQVKGQLLGWHGGAQVMNVRGQVHLWDSAIEETVSFFHYYVV
jgi:hypothetical protein